jgi:hypothetical protein
VPSLWVQQQGQHYLYQLGVALLHRLLQLQVDLRRPQLPDLIKAIRIADTGEIPLQEIENGTAFQERLAFGQLLKFLFHQFQVFLELFLEDDLVFEQCGQEFLKIGKISHDKFRLFPFQGLDLEEDEAGDSLVKLPVVFLHEKLAANGSDVLGQQFETEEVISFALVENGE